MENLNLFDIISCILILISAFLAFFRGFSKEILSIFSWVSSAVLAFIFAPSINPFLNKIPVVAEILSDSCQLSILISYVISFIISLIILSMITPIFTNLIQQSNLSGIDRSLGFCFGVFRGALIIVIVLVVYEIFISDGAGLNTIDESKTTEIFFSMKEQLKNQIPDQKPGWINSRFSTLLSVCDDSV